MTGTTAGLTPILILLLFAGGVGWAPAAHASYGQCRWEGGPGAPTYPACQTEDCVEDGGLAQCTEPELRPPSGWSDSQVDGEKFGYHMCDLAGPSIPRVARWCAAEGGTWVITGASTQECQNLPAEYVGVGGAANENAAIVASDRFAAPAPTSGCSSTLAGDSGWGLVDQTDQLCWTGAPVYQNGKLLRDMRRRDYAYQPSSQCGGGMGIKIMKSRRLVCPVEFASRTKPNGDLQCFIPVQACLNIGNPVTAATGAKIQRETDYRSADGLAFTRVFNSQNRFRVRGSGAFVSGLEDYWRHLYQRKLTPIAGNAYASAAVQREDGSLKYFNASGQELLNCNGAAERLQSLGVSGWKLTLTNLDVEYYDTQGRLTSVVTRTGVTTTVTYGANGRIASIANSFGRALTLAYNASGQLASLTLPGGNQVAYGYDNQGRSTTVTYPDFSVKTYHYEDANNKWLLTGITDENNNRFATYTYSANGLMQAEEHAGGVERYSLSYGDPRQSYMTTQITDPLGRYRQYQFENVAGVFRLRYNSLYCPTCPNVSQASFDANGNYSSKRDLNGKQTTYSYDLTRNLETSRTEAYGTPSARTITTTWDPVFRQPATITEPNRRTSFTYDSSGNTLTRTVTDTSVTPNVSRTWTQTYDAYGHIATMDGPRTDVPDVTTYTYYDCNTGYQCGQVATISNALGQFTTFGSYNPHGQPLTITDPNGVVTTLAYDLRQRLTSRQVGTETTTFEYWPMGLLKKVIQPDGSFLLYTYDAAHRLIQLEDGLGNRIAYALDGDGNRQVENSYDPYGALVRTQTQLYNNLGQLWQVLTAAGTDTQATVYSYDPGGNQKQIDAPLGRSTSYVYDDLNRVKQITDPALGNTLFAYDANDNLTQVTDPRGLVTSYAYTGFGDLKAQTSPDTGLTTQVYDSGGNLATSTDARGAVRSYTYDALNRVTSVVFRVGTTTDQTVTYTYDTGTNGKDRLTSASDANHSLSWTYDGLGRATSKSQTVGSVTKSVGYTYTNGRLTAITLPSGQAVNYGYNTNSQIVSVTLGGAPPTTILNNVLYEPFGPTAGWTWGNGTLAVRLRDLDGRITQIDSAGMSSYSYHDDGSISTRLDDAPTSYTSAPGVTNVSVATSSNRVTGTAGALARAYAYDAIGNTTTLGGTTFSYNFANRMSSSTQGGVTTTYTYSALGQRIRKANAALALFVYDEAGHLIGEYDGLGALIQETVWLEDTPVATLRPNGSGGVNVFYVHTDHLDTPRRVSRPSDNAIVWRWDSDPFGAAAANQDADGDATAFVYNLRFPGQYFDAETGLSYNYFRDYDPAIGRYVQSDPIGLLGGINTYGYVGGNPLSRIDPRGLSGLAGVLPRPWLLPETITRPYPGTIDPVMPIIPDEGDLSGTTDDFLPRNFENCPQDCRGLLKQLLAHEEKLRLYQLNPDAYDNLGFLKFAAGINSPDLRKKIIDGRIRSLQKQIANFRRKYQECLAQHPMA